MCITLLTFFRCRLLCSHPQDHDKPLFMQSPPERSLTLPIRTDATQIAGAPSLSVVPWEIISNYDGFDSADVRAGFQPSVKIFIAHTSQLFLQRNPDKNLLQSQVRSLPMTLLSLLFLPPSFSRIPQYGQSL